jgi:K+-sensing histidine kinase KdpD
MKRWMSSSIGVASCATLAACTIPFFYASSDKTVLPLIFLGIVVMVAIAFGNLAGVLGTVVAAALFALFLFEPRWSISIQDATAKDHLIWMVILGIVLSELFGRFPKRENTAPHV